MNFIWNQFYWKDYLLTFLSRTLEMEYEIDFDVYFSINVIMSQ
jgi:hypothetical protein